MNENKSLIKFHKEICPDLPIDIFEFFCRLVAALNNTSESTDVKQYTSGDADG